MIQCCNYCIKFCVNILITYCSVNFFLPSTVALGSIICFSITKAKIGILSWKVHNGQWSLSTCWQHSMLLRANRLLMMPILPVMDQVPILKSILSQWIKALRTINMQGKYSDQLLLSNLDYNTPSEVENNWLSITPQGKIKWKDV